VGAQERRDRKDEDAAQELEARGKIAFASDLEGNFEIYLLDPTGGGLVKVTDNAAEDFDPSFSPDGERLAFVSDRGGDQNIFSAGDNGHDGPHQRCWVHLLRDIHDLRAAHADDAALAAWGEAVHGLYLEAKRVAAGDADFAARAAARADIERRLSAACAPYWDAGCPAPQATLCQRIDRFLDELFEFVLDPTLPSDNNRAERSLRPLVTARKISGGTRSAEGSAVRMALASLFATWQAQDRDPFTACHQLLLARSL
jgi:hypothetical protein